MNRLSIAAALTTTTLLGMGCGKLESQEPPQVPTYNSPALGAAQAISGTAVEAPVPSASAAAATK
jgi:hypothetical protein